MFWFPFSVGKNPSPSASNPIFPAKNRANPSPILPLQDPQYTLFTTGIDQVSVKSNTFCLILYYSITVALITTVEMWGLILFCALLHNVFATKPDPIEIEGGKIQGLQKN